MSLAKSVRNSRRSICGISLCELDFEDRDDGR